MYTKALLTTQDKRMESFIKQLLRRLNIEIETGFPLLTDLDAIRYDLMKNKITVNIRAEFARFIKENGFPSVILMDYQIDFGLTEKEDPDQRKLLRTFLLAFALLANAKGYETARASIIFIISKKLKSTMTHYANYPSFLLDEIRTKDARVNAIIDSFALNTEKVKAFFNLSFIFKPDDGRYTVEMEKLEKILGTVPESSGEAAAKPEAGKPSTQMILDDLEPAHVICRASVEKVIVDGELQPVTEDQKGRYIEKNIHLEGALTQKTLAVVKSRILTVFDAMGKVNPLKKDEKIFINVPDSSVIDGSFASTMGTFLSSVFPEYTGISLNIGKENSEKMRNSKGYVAIKDYILKNL